MADETTQQAEQKVFPLSEFNPIDPVPGAIYDDELYAQQQAGGSGKQEPASPQPTTTEEPPAADPAPAPQFDLDAVIKEKTGGKFEKWDDVFTKVNSEFTFENETSKKVFEYLREGKEAELTQLLLQKQMVAKVEEMGEEDAIKMYMRIDDPDASDEDIEDDFRDRFGDAPDKDTMDESEYRKAMRKYNKLVRSEGEKAKEALVKLREQIVLPDIQKDKPQVISPDDLSQETEEFKKDLSASVEEAMKEIGSLKFDFEDKDKGVQFSHEFKMTDQDKADLKSFFNDFFESFDKQYKTNGGTYDGKKLATDFFFALNKDKIMKSAAMNGYSQGKYGTAANIANVNVTPTTSPAIDIAAENYTKAARSFIEG